LACSLLERHHEANEFEGSEQAVVVLVVNKDVIIRRQKLLADTRQGLLVKLLPTSLQQEELKEVIVDVPCKNKRDRPLTI
jgi:hypothetical protein